MRIATTILAGRTRDLVELKTANTALANVDSECKISFVRKKWLRYP